MIIFGMRGVSSTIESGHFDCPQCEQEEEYKLKKSTRFFTLYFIPLIPLGKLGEYVECQYCKGTFIPNILDYEDGYNDEEDDVLAEYEKAMKYCLVKMMLADGEIDNREKVIIKNVVNKISHHDIELADIDELIEDVEYYAQDLEDYLQEVTPRLNAHGKELIIKAAYSVAVADGHVDEDEMDLLRTIAKAMEISKSHLRGILADLKDVDRQRARMN